MITALTDPAQLPNQLDDQETFDTKMANFLDNLPTRAQQENELAANMGMYAAGGAYAFPYVFDSSTADADPGVGKLRLSSATQNAASIVMRMDLQAVGGADMTNVLADLRAATSAVKGSVRLVKMTDPSKWLIFDITAVAVPSGYRNLTATWRATGGGSASPFANGDALMVFIDRNGDSGTVPGATELLATVNVTSAVATISLPAVFDTDHDWYLVDIESLSLSANGSLLSRFISGGSVISTGYASSIVNSGFASGSAAFFLSETPSVSFSGVLQFRNVNNQTFRGMIWDGVSVSSTGSNPYYAIGKRGAHAGATQTMNGFDLTNGGGANIVAGTVRVYGVRKV